jgi:hypothetical protein
MDTDEKDRRVRTSGETGSLEETDDMQDVLDLLDATLEEDEDSLGKYGTGVTPGSGKGEEDLIDLIEVVEEPSEEEPAVDMAVEGEPEDLLSLELEAPDDEDILDLVEDVRDAPGLGDEEVLELVDEAEDEADEGVIELTDVAAGQDAGLAEEVALEFSDVDLELEEPDEDRLPEDLGVEIAEEPLGVPLAGETALQKEPSAPAPEYATPSEAAAQPSQQALESMVAARLSDEKIEEIITRVAKEAMEKKADRILLEVAEAAIAKEIERLKKAL